MRLQNGDTRLEESSRALRGISYIHADLADILNLPMTFEPLRVRTGFDMKAEPAAVTPDNSGVYHITVREVNRVEIDLTHFRQLIFRTLCK
jgi:hypothetical protein